MTPQYKPRHFTRPGTRWIAHRLGLRIRRATIVREGDASGHVLHDSPLRGIQLDLDGSDRARLRVERAICICFAGPIAQRKFRASSWRKWHGAQDYDTIGELALRVSGDGETATAFARWLELRTVAMVGLEWPAIERTAALLIEQKMLSQADVARCCERPRRPAGVVRLIDPMAPERKIG